MSYIYDIGDAIKFDYDVVNRFRYEAPNRWSQEWLTLLLNYCGLPYTVRNYFQRDGIGESYRYLSDNWYDVGFTYGPVPECVICSDKEPLVKYTKSRFLVFDKIASAIEKAS